MPTAATDAFLARPIVMHGLSAHQVLRAVAQGHYDATAERRALIEATLERLADLREKLIAKLDALDADPDLEPFLCAAELMDQRDWASGILDDRERDDDLEPSLGSVERLDQRAWSMGGCTDAELEHDGREPDEPQFCNWQNEGDQTFLIMEEL